MAMRSLRPTPQSIAATGDVDNAIVLTNGGGVSIVDDLDGFAEPPIDRASEEDPNAVLCAFPDCDNTFVRSPIGFGKKRKFCDEHLSKGSSRPGKRARDRKPAGLNVNVQVGGTKKGKDAELDKVRANALMLANVIAGAMAMLAAENETLKADAADVHAGAEPWADSVRELARYEDWLRKLAQGGEATERAMAWVGFIFATVGMLVPILLRHKVLPAEVAQLIQAQTAVEPVAA